MINSRLSKQTILISAFALTGCAATVNSYTDASKIEVPQAAAKKVTLRLTGTPEIQVSNRWQKFSDEWYWKMQYEAESRNIPYTFAAKDSDIGDEPGTLVRINVKDFRYISQVERYFLGIVLGNAYMDIDVEYVELPSKRLIATKKFNTTTTAWEGVYSAATPKQVVAVIQVILNDIQGRTPKPQ